MSERDRKDWNANIIWKMRVELEYQWDIIEEDVPGLFSALSSEVGAVSGDLKQSTVSRSSSQPGLSQTEFVSDCEASRTFAMMGLAANSPKVWLASAVFVIQGSVSYPCGSLVLFIHDPMLPSR